MQHEYSILDHDRGQIFQWIGTAIALLAAAYTVGFGAISQIVERIPAESWNSVPVWLTGNIPKILGMIPKALDVGIAFALMYAAFNKWIWKTWIFKRYLNYRDLSGEWTVDGLTIGPLEALDNGKSRSWQATIIITQQWTKLSVRLRLQDSSTSYSRSAALQCVGDETLLMYSYANEPTMNERHEKGLQTHIGYCELRFAEDGKTGHGSYFNNLGRVTYGEMTLNKAKGKK